MGATVLVVKKRALLWLWRHGYGKSFLNGGRGGDSHGGFAVVVANRLRIILAEDMVSVPVGNRLVYCDTSGVLVEDANGGHGKVTDEVFMGANQMQIKVFR